MWHGGPSDGFEAADEAGLIEHYTSDATAAIPDTYKSADGTWTGVYVGVLGFCSNSKVLDKIGAGAPLGAVFVGRRPTGEIWTPELAAAHPGRDWILTRILWLCGEEPGFNRLGEVDTMRRYIYIHGAPDTVPMGVPMISAISL